MDLLEAVESGDEAGVKRCLDDGADALFADDEGFTCLHMAAQEGYDAIAMMLLRKGALVDATDDSGVTPLMLAAEAGHDVCVAILVKEKANVLLSDKLGKTALFRAVAVAGSAASAKALLDASADASACPIAGKTLVNLAAAKDKECAKLIERALSPWVSLSVSSRRRERAVLPPSPPCWMQARHSRRRMRTVGLHCTSPLGTAIPRLWSSS